ncbi:hypothetical protein [Streptomyces sp. NPDC006879]|uniref:hypothetical protein n=1 Tax=Streptomyces sp. NPDC006879 TaxID=3364767 RepID=UPI00367E4EE4
MRIPRSFWLIPAALLAALLPAAALPARQGPEVTSASVAALGRGTVELYTEYEPNGRPRTLGVALSESALSSLPTSATDGRHCFDADGDGSTDPMHECVGGHSSELALPAVPPGAAELPVQWALVNWNPHGHTPHGRYDVPHFDVHFYLDSPEERAGIRLGRCSLLIDCDQLAAASRPVPAAYLPAGYPASSPRTAEGAMGAHLDSRPPTAGTLVGQTLIYGAFDGRLTFIEPMVTRDFVDSQRTRKSHRSCEPIPQPAAWRVAGWYPTRYCTAYRAGERDYAVYLTDFVHRSATMAAFGLPVR